MRIRNAFTAFAASYFVIVFLKDGTMEKLVKDASRGAQDLTHGARRLTKIT
jgi:hypothetical protein